MSTREADGKAQGSMTIEGEPVMTSVAYALTRMENTPTLAIRSKGRSIPNAVAVANIIKEMKGGIRVQKITLDTDAAPGIGRMTSTVEIILERSQA